jgi:hypothetical protein
MNAIIKNDEQIVTGFTLTDLLKEYGVLNESKTIIPHLVTLHNKGTIGLDVKTLVDNHKNDTWNRRMRIDIKDLSAYGLVHLLIEPMMYETCTRKMHMIDRNTIEFVWE